MPDLRGQFFAGPAALSEDTLARLTIASPIQGVLDALANSNWNGAPVATVTINTSVDGTRTTDGRFALWGDLAGGDINIPAVKLWEGVPKGTTLQVANLVGQQFTFPSGQLNSEFASQLPFDVSYARAGAPINQRNWATEGIGELSFRAVCHLDKSSNRSPPPKIKYTILASPMSPLELAELADRTQHVAWPGIKILEGTAALWPAPDNDGWAAPVYPFIGIRDRQPGTTATPPVNHLLFALAEIMRTAALPTACTTLEALNTKCQEMLEADDDPETRGPTITWPPVERPAPDIGKLYFT